MIFGDLVDYWPGKSWIEFLEWSWTYSYKCRHTATAGLRRLRLYWYNGQY